MASREAASFTLRPATEADWDFLWELRCSTMKRMIEETYGWVDADQQKYTAESLQGQIVLRDDQRVGIVTLVDWGDQIHLVWLATLPSLHGSGLGTALLQHAQKVAITEGKPLTLQVLINNPAINLYKRHGFEFIEDNGAFKKVLGWFPSGLSPDPTLTIKGHL